MGSYPICVHSHTTCSKCNGECTNAPPKPETQFDPSPAPSRSPCSRRGGWGPALNRSASCTQPPPDCRELRQPNNQTGIRRHHEGPSSTFTARFALGTLYHIASNISGQRKHAILWPCIQVPVQIRDCALSGCSPTSGSNHRTPQTIYFRERFMRSSEELGFHPHSLAQYCVCMLIDACVIAPVAPCRASLWGAGTPTPPSLGFTLGITRITCPRKVHVSGRRTARWRRTARCALSKERITTSDTHTLRMMGTRTFPGKCAAWPHAGYSCTQESAKAKGGVTVTGQLFGRHPNRQSTVLSIQVRHGHPIPIGGNHQDYCGGSNDLLCGLLTLQAIVYTGISLST